jgi:hypothetical protein
MMATVHAAVVQVAAQLQRIPLPMLRRLVWLILLLYGCNIVARIFWLMLPPPDPIVAAAVQHQMAVTDPDNAPAQPASVDITALANLHLFGKAELARQPTVAVRPVAIEAEQTRLELLLLASWLVPIHQQLVPLLRTATNRIFLPWVTIYQGVQVQLEQVLPGRVIINNG